MSEYKEENNMSICGVIFTEQEKNSLTVLSSCSAMLPFAGECKIMDFVISDMVNAGIEKIGIVTKKNYKSISSHIRNGKDWDIKRDAIKIVLSYDPRYYASRYDSFDEKLGELISLMQYIDTLKGENVLLCDCRHIYNVDTDCFIELHKNQNSDITIGVIDNSERIFMLIKLEVLKEILQDAIRQYTALGIFELIEKTKDKYKASEYKLNGYVTSVASLKDYYKNSLELLHSSERRSQLFPKDRDAVYTQTSSHSPSMYGEESTVSSSIVCDGCKINGTVENSIVYNNVYVGKGAVIKNSILLPGTKINENAFLDCVISGSNSYIAENTRLDSDRQNPIVFTN